MIMSETTLTFRVDEALKTQFATIAKQHDRTASQLLRDFMRNVVNQEVVPFVETNVTALSSAQKAELDMRYEEYKAGKVKTIDAKDMFGELRKKYSWSALFLANVRKEKLM